jgi:hypothetical protein
MLTSPVLLIADVRLLGEIKNLVHGPYGPGDGSTIDIVTATPADLDGFRTVVTIGIIDEDLHRAAARAANAAGKPNTSLRLAEDAFEIGPFNLPGLSACLDCYLQRLTPDIPLSTTDGAEATGYDANRTTTAPRPDLLRLGVAALGTQFVRTPVREHSMVARVHRCRVPDLSWDHHWVHQVPGCSTCHIGSTNPQRRGAP